MQKKKKNQIHVSKREGGFPVETAPLQDFQYQVVNFKKVSGVRSTFMVERKQNAEFKAVGPRGTCGPSHRDSDSLGLSWGSDQV